MRDQWKNRRAANLGEYIAQRTIRAENGCLLWKTALVNRPGWFCFGGLKTNAPRAVYLLCKGAIPEDQMVRHTCDDRRCVERSHLILGTSSQNRKDFMERNPRAMEICNQALAIARAKIRERRSA